MRRFDPQLLLVSAGFDAHDEDPLADMAVTADGFREMARRCRGLAPRVAAVLEGGYNLDTLPSLVEAALSGYTPYTAGCSSRPFSPIRHRFSVPKEKSFTAISVTGP